MMHVGTFAGTCGTKLKQGSSCIFRNSMPQYRFLGVAASGAGWYGKRVFLVYGPAIITDIFIRISTQNSSFPFWSKFTAKWVWAPAVVPEMVSVGSWIVGLAIAYFVVLGGNMFGHAIYHYVRSTPNPCQTTEI